MLACAGNKEVITGVVPTVKLTPLLAKPPTLTTRFPVVAPDGTAVVMRSVCQKVGTAGVPLNVTELDPWVAPKLLPRMLTPAPTDPPAGDTVEIVGGGTVTVNGTPLPLTPLTVTIMFPVV